MYARSSSRVSGGSSGSGAQIVAEPVRLRLEDRERLHVGLLLGGVGTPRHERDRDVVAGVPRGLLDGGAPAQDDQIGQRHLCCRRTGIVEVGLDLLQDRQHLGQLGRAVDLPVPLGGRRIRAPFAPPRLSVPRKLAADAQAVETSCGMDRPDSRSRLLSSAMSSAWTSPWSTAGTGSCHSWGSGTQGPRYRRHGSHVPVQQLEPRLGEGLVELVRVLVEALRDRTIDRVHLQGEVRGQHDRGMAPVRVVGVGHGAPGRRILGRPLLGAGWAGGQLQS